MINLSQIRSGIDRRKGQRDAVAQHCKIASEALVTLEGDYDAADKARFIIQEVAQLTQKELEYHVSELVSLALSAVFDDPYKFGVDFVIKRERTEAELYFERDGERINPISASGGGAVDVAANALRFSLWSLKSPRTRNTIVLDEPFRFLSKDNQPRAADMLREISKRLRIQIIMVSHNPELIESADKAFEVSIRQGVSSVQEVVNESGGNSTGENGKHKTSRKSDNEDRANELDRVGGGKNKDVARSKQRGGGNNN